MCYTDSLLRRWTWMAAPSLLDIPSACPAAGCWWPCCMLSRGLGAKWAWHLCALEEGWASPCVWRGSEMRTSPCQGDCTWFYGDKGNLFTLNNSLEWCILALTYNCSLCKHKNVMDIVGPYAIIAIHCHCELKLSSQVCKACGFVILSKTCFCWRWMM